MRTLSRLRILLVLPAVVALLCGVLSGLARMGLPMPAHAVNLVGVHGALMVGGFFGTLIGLERAVAMRRGWPYLAPVLSGLGVPALLLAPPAVAPVAMILAASCLTAASASMWLRQREPYLATLAAGALAWLLGNVVWAADSAIYPAVPLWAAFLILTIAGERLELSRYVPTPVAARRAFAVVVVALLAGALAGAVRAGALVVFAGALFALAAWLLRFDIARRTVRGQGLTRYMAVCLLSGYAWLAVAAALGAAGALRPEDPLRDAALHAMLLGFVFAMVFGHAPVILPAITRVKMRWHPGFYVPLAILHVTVLARVGAGIAGDFALRQLAGIGNALALALFAATVVTALRFERQAPGRAPQGRPRKTYTARLPL